MNKKLNDLSDILKLSKKDLTSSANDSHQLALLNNKHKPKRKSIVNPTPSFKSINNLKLRVVIELY